MSHDEYKKFINQSNGILIFVTSFLGIAFLMAAGCIIYIKQMDETEDELDNFKILRRIGFTYTDMSNGLLLKLHLILDYRFSLLYYMHYLQHLHL